MVAFYCHGALQPGAGRFLPARHELGTAARAYRQRPRCRQPAGDHLGICRTGFFVCTATTARPVASIAAGPGNTGCGICPGVVPAASSRALRGYQRCTGGVRRLVDSHALGNPGTLFCFSRSLPSPGIRGTKPDRRDAWVTGMLSADLAVHYSPPWRGITFCGFARIRRVEKIGQ